MNAPTVRRAAARLLTLTLLACTAARAADIVVTSASDALIFPIGACTLRNAIEAANTDATSSFCPAGSGADRILFEGVDSVTLLSDGLEISEDLIIDGRGTLVTIRREPGDADAFRILDVSGGSSLTLRWIAIENGELAADAPADSDGAGIRSNGAVVLEDSSVSGSRNLADSGHGGGIAAETVQLDRSRVLDNAASTFGGGIYAGQVNLVDSVIAGNMANGEFGQGGGVTAGQISATRSSIHGNIAAQAAGGLYGTFVTLRNSTVSGNTAANLCGGGLVGQVISIQNSTVSDNAAGDNATGGVCALTPPDELHSLSISNSIVRGNLGDIGSLQSPVFVAGSANIIGPVAGNVDLPPDTLDCDPGLAALADNGGPTPTHAIADGSCAQDAGSNPFDLPTDQRGEPRSSGAGTDIGAFELQSGDLFGDGFES